MSEAAQRFRAAAIERVLGERGQATQAERRAAFAAENVSPGARGLIEKVARNAWKVTDDDIDGAIVAGLSEDQIFELCVCAAMGQATRQLDAAMALLDEVAP